MGNLRSGASEALSLVDVTRVVDGETLLYSTKLAFEPGTFTCLLGRTRAGKTTLLRMLAGLDAPSAGAIYLGTRDVTKVHVRERDVAMVYQQFVNYPSLTVFENIASPLRLKREISAPEIERRVREVADTLGLSALLTRLPAELSGGQQQRTAIARALVKDASLILLDEPLANLDYKLREELRAQLRSLFARRRAIVVYATAEPDEALLLGGRTVVLDEGRVLQEGASFEVYSRPENQRAAEVFSDPQLNLLDLEVQSAGLWQLAGDAPMPTLRSFPELAPGRYNVGVRAHHLTLVGREGDLRVSATTLVDEVTGSSTLLHVAHGQRTLTAQLPGIQRRVLGSPVELFVSPDNIILFDQAGQVLRGQVPSPSAS